MTSTTIEIVLPPNSMGKVLIIPWGWNICPSNYFYHDAYVLRFGEPREFQHDIEIMQVEAPSSIRVRKIFSPIDLTLIWKGI